MSLPVKNWRILLEQSFTARRWQVVSNKLFRCHNTSTAVKQLRLNSTLKHNAVIWLHNYYYFYLMPVSPNEHESAVSYSGPPLPSV